VEKQLIVGVDPGTSVGLAFLDIDGNVVEVLSKRGMSIDDAIMEISRRGSAAVIATDKGESPAMVTKVASIMGARLFTPGNDLSVEKKRELTGDFKTDNDHERDSLAAARYAYYNFQNKIRRVERQVQEQLDDIKARVLKGEKVSELFEVRQEKSSETEQLNAQITALRKQVRELQSELETRDRRRPKHPQAVLREAAKEAKQLMLDLAKGRYVMLKDVPSLDYLDLKGIPIKKGDYILCQSKESDGKGLRFLESKRVGAIIAPVELDSLAPTCKIEDIVIIAWEGLYFAESVEVDKACGRRKEVQARDLHDMLVDYKKGRR
jgi:predicted RNase H-like nuclease (RuvC/YqgF family)